MKLGKHPQEDSQNLAKHGRALVGFEAGPQKAPASINSRSSGMRDALLKWLATRGGLSDNICDSIAIYPRCIWGWQLLKLLQYLYDTSCPPHLDGVDAHASRVQNTNVKSSWTPKVCKTIAFWAMLNCFGDHFTYFGTFGRPGGVVRAASWLQGL